MCLYIYVCYIAYDSTLPVIILSNHPKDASIQGIVPVVVQQLQILELPCWQVQRYEQNTRMLQLVG